MSDNNVSQNNQPHIFGDVEPDELQRLAGLKQQGDQIIHQVGINRVNEQRLMDQLRQVEQATNAIVTVAGKRLGIPEGQPWSVTSDGKAIQVGDAPAPTSVRLAPVPDEDTTPEV